ARALDVVLEQRVAGPDAVQLRPDLLLLLELAAEAVLALASRVVVGADAGDAARDLGAELARELVLEPAELDHAGMVLAEPLVEAGALRLHVEQRQTQLLYPGAGEAVGERVGVGLREELVAALERQPVGLRLGEERRHLRHALAAHLVLLVDGDVGVLGGEAVEGLLRTLDASAGLADLPLEEPARD